MFTQSKHRGFLPSKAMLDNLKLDDDRYFEIRLMMLAKKSLESQR